MEDGRNVSKIRTKSFGFTNVNVNNLNGISAQKILLQAYLSVLYLQYLLIGCAAWLVGS